MAAQRNRRQRDGRFRGRPVCGSGFVVGVALVAGSVAVLNLSGNETRRLVDQLNARYVENIEIEAVARGGGGYKDLIVVDAVTRYDCTEEDGWLTCSDYPTRE